MGSTTGYTYFDDGLPATDTAKAVSQPDGTRRDIVQVSNDVALGCASAQAA
ncbi:hypothetical protein [Streptomyces parvus]|uniref:hypothetical protein n=1 Tax=Streptomyces parvus TaxID=66428 RepID=UPI0033EE842D